MRRLLVPAIAIIWTAVLFLVYGQLVRMDEEDTRRVALAQARALFQQVVDARSWNAAHGGVYVEVDEATQPNPYLDVPGRDLVTTDGRKLTLVNPAYMTRKIAEIGRQRRGVVIHITSLKPLNPGNKPLPWEEGALRTFEGGTDYLAEFFDKAGDERSFRYMEPLLVEESCLTCHARQGYEPGDIRGGISVTFPARDLVRSMAIFRLELGMVLVMVWLLGLALMGSLNMFFVQKQRQVEELRNLALVDELTGLNNRRAFFALAGQQMEWIGRFSQKALLLFFDLDDLKGINDRFGHEEGDAALKLAAEALRNSFRASDIVSRYAGDEFAAFLPKSSLVHRDLIVGRVRDNVNEQNRKVGKDYTLSVSIGVAEFDPEAPVSLEDLTREADRKMYGEKKTENGK
jgi:diguanylate cyclase (GGDEF)-like protein